MITLCSKPGQDVQNKRQESHRLESSDILHKTEESYYEGPSRVFKEAMALFP